MTPPKMMTVADAARESGLTQYCVRQLLRDGRVKGVRIGKGKILCNFDSLCQYLNEAIVGGDENDRSR